MIGPGPRTWSRSRRTPSSVPRRRSRSATLALGVLERAGRRRAHCGSRSPTLPRVVATDLDGTLLRSDGTISARTARTVALEEAGVDVVFVTASARKWLEPLADASAGTDGHLRDRAFVYDVPSRSILSSHVLDAGLVAGARGRAAWHAPGRSTRDPGARRAAVRVALPAPVAPEPTWRSAPRVEEFLDVRSASSWSSAHGPGGRARGAGRGAPRGARGRVPLRAPSLAEVSARGVTKAAALERWCTARGYASTDVWAFGDMPNDLPMLQWASRSFAVAGRTPRCSPRRTTWSRATTTTASRRSWTRRRRAG